MPVRSSNETTDEWSTSGLKGLPVDGRERSLVHFTLAFVLLLGFATWASAQAASPSAGPARSMTDILTFLVTNEVDTGSFERDRAAALATSVTISRALLANLATLPVTSSSGAFAYHLKPELGTVERATQSFGLFFLERALTAGRHQASIGLTFQHLRFTSLDGSNLRDGSLVTTANQFIDEAEPFDVDQLTLRINADIATLYGNVGLTDMIEVGFAAPMIALRLDGSRVNNYRGRTFTQATGSAWAIGLADVVVRAKATVFNEEGAGLAAAADLRLPTGRERDLLGAGSPSLKLSAIGSLERGRFSTHANAGGSVGGLARELLYGGAVSMAASERVTVSGELHGRWLDSFGHIVATAVPHPKLIDVRTIRLTPDASTLQILTAVPGVKCNLTDTWVLSANVSMPLTSGGLTSRFTPFVGLDYAFER